MPMRVVVEPYQSCWAEMFADESRRIAQALGPSAVVIHHIGSTAIPGIYAKPIIDLLVEARDVAELDAKTEAMAALQYEAMGEFGIPGRRYFRKDGTEGRRTHQVHAFAVDSPQIERHLAFRDFLIAHPEWARQYSDLKQQLAAAHSESIDRYMDGKDAFIQEVDRRAAAWRKGMPNLS